MDYSQLNDDEINIRVGESFGWNAYYIHPNGSVTFRDDKGKIKGKKNYCNNPADAWPIIAESKICLAFDVFAEPQDGGGWVASPAYGWENERVRHDNPLRAAMISFLKRQEPANVPANPSGTDLL